MFTNTISECSFSNQRVSKSNSELIFTSTRLTIKQNIMSLKYSTTTADYLVWYDAMNLIRKLAKDGNYKISLLIALGCFTGLRISDILALRWNQILDTGEFTIIEIKTGKQRTVRINPQLQEHIRDCYRHINPIGVNAPILVSQKGTVFTIQRINVILKETKKNYRLHIGNFSCHSLRKTFGRQVYNMNSDNAELALVKLMELYNHSNVAITKRYLGLRQEEILQTYDCLSF
jgi:integrase